MKRFRVDTTEAIEAQPKSYEQIIDSDTEQPWSKLIQDRKAPARHGSYSHSVTQRNEQQSSGIFASLWQLLFGSTESEPQKPTKKRSTEKRTQYRRGNNKKGNYNQSSNRTRSNQPAKDGNTQQPGYEKNSSTRGAHGNRRRQNRRPRSNNAQQPIKNENLIDHYGD